MAGGIAPGKKQVFGEINITPLTDIFLVLLIIMMVVAPMVQQTRGDIHPPEIQSGSPVPKATTTVDITADGKFFVDSVESGEVDLPRMLRDTVVAGGPKHVTIRADKATKGHAVMAVFNAAQDAQFEKIMVVGAVPATKPAALETPVPETEEPKE